MADCFRPNRKLILYIFLIFRLKKIFFTPCWTCFWYHWFCTMDSRFNWSPETSLIYQGFTFFCIAVYVICFFICSVYLFPGIQSCFGNNKKLNKKLNEQEWDQKRDNYMNWLTQKFINLGLLYSPQIEKKCVISSVHNKQIPRHYVCVKCDINQFRWKIWEIGKVWETETD